MADTSHRALTERFAQGPGWAVSLGWSPDAGPGCWIVTAVAKGDTWVNAHADVRDAETKFAMHVQHYSTAS